MCDLIHVDVRPSAGGHNRSRSRADGMSTHAGSSSSCFRPFATRAMPARCCAPLMPPALTAVVFSDNSVDPYNGKCVRASAGSIFHLPIVVGVPILAAIDELRQPGYQVFAADGAPPTAEPRRASTARASWPQPTAWVFGNEAWGLPAAVLQAADRTVGVPIHGRAESLNLAAAAAVCLYASARARQRAAMSVRSEAIGLAGCSEISGTSGGSSRGCRHRAREGRVRRCCPTAC